MTAIKISKNIKTVLLLFGFMVLLPYAMNAQRTGHSASRGSSSKQTQSRPATQNKSTQSRQTRQTQSKPQSRPSTQQSRPSNNKSINGGHQKSTTRPATRPSTTNRSTTNRPSTTTKKNNINSGNKTNNINNSKKNINIDNSKNVTINTNNTRVRASSKHYHRPPYRYGGRSYYCHRPYHHHPYRPYRYGPAWHPWGFFVATLATTAIIVSINNQKYHYDAGVYYVSSSGGYTVVQAPVGATVETLPKETEKVVVNETTNNYYYGGAFYEKNADGYVVVQATAGTIVPNLPEGGEEVKIGEVTYVKFGETYYQPIQVDGKDMYEIVEVKAD